MIFENDLNYYEVLDLPQDATALDIKTAYFKVKQAYKKNNLAVYSLMDDSETDEMLQKIEEAYQVLSDPELKQDYDERNGLKIQKQKKVISIDRFPPMESSDDSDILIPPSTDFTARSNDSSYSNAKEAEINTISSFTSAIDQLEDEIKNETEWSGSFLRKIREIKRYSLDDMATQTKISKTYIRAIEEESFDKLPAPVFVRGFVTQISKVLKLPVDHVAPAYMSRYKKA